MLYLEIIRRRTPQILFRFLLVLIAGSAVAQQQDLQDSTAVPSQEITYNIPPQSLAEALSAYGASSGTQVLYETSLTAGRSSAAVKGKFTPEAALQTLLAGTGLVGRRTDVDAITILLEPQNRASRNSLAAPDARFLGTLQASILNALCHRAETRPGNYRMALQLWITPSGAIQRASLLSSTGDTRRDEALTEVLHDVMIGALLPAGMGQPVTLVIVPRSPLHPPECGLK
jgi:hypothetical protein